MSSYLDASQVVQCRASLPEDWINATASPSCGVAHRKKTLWCSSNQKDNYINDFFLQSLVVNASVRERSYWRVVWAALAVDQQLSIVAIVSSIAYLLYSEALSTRLLLFFEAAIMLGVILLQSLALFSARDHFYTNIRQTGTRATIMVLLIAVLTPVYGTLAGSISSDSVVTLAVLLLLGHLYLYDYKQPLPKGNTVKGSISLACALCSSVLLASQLKKLENVFALVSYSAEQNSQPQYVILTIFSSISSTQ